MTADLAGTLAAPARSRAPTSSRGVRRVASTSSSRTGKAPVDAAHRRSRVAGVWWYDGAEPPAPSATDARGRQVTYCYLDDDPVATAERLGEVMRRRWASGDVTGLLAAPFYMPGAVRVDPLSAWRRRALRRRSHRGRPRRQRESRRVRRDRRDRPRGARALLATPGCDVIGVSRRAVDVEGVLHVPLDLLDRRACERAGRAMAGVTHVVYAALQESDDLTAGWRDHALMERNLAMFANALEPVLDATGDTLEHVSLLQGAKAYGLHVGRATVPAKERAPRDEHDNFYFLQEDRLRTLAAGAAWSWTILRPQVVYGRSFGSPMNLIPVLGVYGALGPRRGRPLSFPGGPPHIQEAVDARLLAARSRLGGDRARGAG